MELVDQGLLFDAAAAPSHARFCSFCSLEVLADGRLVAAFRAGSSKDAADENIILRRSEDGGRSWKTILTGFPHLPADRPGSLRAAGLCAVAPGRLVATLLWTDRSDPALPLANPETQGILPTRVLVTTSTDGGETWTRPQEVSLAPHRGNAITGDPFQLQDGRLALPYEAWKEYHDAGYGLHHAALRLSPDSGASWAATSEIVAHDTAGHLLYWDQRLTVAPDDGQLLAMFWSHHRPSQQDRPIHIAWGSPDAATWSAPHSTGIQGQICAPLALGGGRVLAAYVHRHHPPGLRAVLSRDFGWSWDVDNEVIFYAKGNTGSESGMGGERDFGDYWADMNVWTFGHPAPLRLPDGHVLIAYYAGDDSAMSVHWVRLAVD